MGPHAVVQAVPCTPPGATATASGVPGVTRLGRLAEPLALPSSPPSSRGRMRLCSKGKREMSLGTSSVVIGGDSVR